MVVHFRYDIIFFMAEFKTLRVNSVKLGKLEPTEFTSFLGLRAVNQYYIIKQNHPVNQTLKNRKHLIQYCIFKP